MSSNQNQQRLRVYFCRKGHTFGRFTPPGLAMIAQNNGYNLGHREGQRENGNCNLHADVNPDKRVSKVS